MQGSSEIKDTELQGEAQCKGKVDHNAEECKGN